MEILPHYFSPLEGLTSREKSSSEHYSDGTLSTVFSSTSLDLLTSNISINQSINQECMGISVKHKNQICDNMYIRMEWNKFLCSQDLEVFYFVEITTVLLGAKMHGNHWLRINT